MSNTLSIPCFIVYRSRPPSNSPPGGLIAVTSDYCKESYFHRGKNPGNGASSGARQSSLTTSFAFLYNIKQSSHIFNIAVTCAEFINKLQLFIQQTSLSCIWHSAPPNGADGMLSMSSLTRSGRSSRSSIPASVLLRSNFRP